MDVYQDKQFGLYRDRLFCWDVALQRYGSSHHVNNRCEINKRKEDDRIFLCKINLCLRGIHAVIISINFVTGMISVKGKPYTEWIESEFDKEGKTCKDTDETNKEISSCNTTDESGKRLM